MKILVVDDNISRSIEIENVLTEKCNFLSENIFIANNIQDAKKLIRANYYDVLILDVVLPRRDETPSAENGLKFLEEIVRRPQLNKPGRIIGITAHINDIQRFRKRFDEFCFSIIEASHSNKSWKANIIAALNYSKTSQISMSHSTAHTICLSIHGIQTRGQWQESLKKIIQGETDKVQFETYKYGYFSIISFFIPFLRLAVINNFSKSLLNISKLYPEKNIIIFSHSFGTYVAVNSIENLLKKKHKINLHTLVLSGSVLKSSYNFQSILDATDVKVINDCGVDDNILLLSEGLVPNTGMAGRIGFHGLNNSRFVNRFFVGSHSHYFENNSNFMRNYWLPLFSDRYQLGAVDFRKDNWVRSNVLEGGVLLLGKFKEILFITAFVYMLYSLL